MPFALLLRREERLEDVRPDRPRDARPGVARRPASRSRPASRPTRARRLVRRHTSVRGRDRRAGPPPASRRARSRTGSSAPARSARDRPASSTDRPLAASSVSSTSSPTSAIEQRLRRSSMTSFRSSTRGCSTCLRLNASSCRVSEAARSAERRISCDVAARRIVVRQLLEQQVGVAEDRGQDVVEVVRDPAGQPTHGFHLVRLPQLLLAGAQRFLGRLPLRDVAMVGDDGPDRGVSRWLTMTACPKRSEPSLCRKRYSTVRGSPG